MPFDLDVVVDVGLDRSEVGHLVTLQWRACSVGALMAMKVPVWIPCSV
jgi:hypothetical protein